MRETKREGDRSGARLVVQYGSMTASQREPCKSSPCPRDVRLDDVTTPYVIFVLLFKH